MSAAPHTSASGPVLAVEDLTLTVRNGARRLKIVDKVSFRIEPGQFFALVGESGSGKTMIARAVMRLMPDEVLDIAGAIRFGGHDLATAGEATMRPLRGSRISMIFQEPMSSLDPLMTVGRQIGEAIDAHGQVPAKDKHERIVKLLSQVRFRDPELVMTQYPHELSGGMRQRVMIAGALINGPQLLIADEPTTALDVTIQKEVLEILAGLAREYGLSVLFISHDLSLVYEYADEIAVLYGGVLMERGPARTVIDQPSHPYTAALLSCVPRRRMQGARQEGIEGTVPGVAHWPPGCRFAERCRYVRDECRTGAIAMRDDAAGRAVRCVTPLGLEASPP